MSKFRWLVILLCFVVLTGCRRTDIETGGEETTASDVLSAQREGRSINTINETKGNKVFTDNVNSDDIFTVFEEIGDDEQARFVGYMENVNIVKQYSSVCVWFNAEDYTVTYNKPEVEKAISILDYYLCVVETEDGREELVYIPSNYQEFNGEGYKRVISEKVVGNTIESIRKIAKGIELDSSAEEMKNSSVVSVPLSEQWRQAKRDVNDTIKGTSEREQALYALWETGCEVLRNEKDFPIWQWQEKYFIPESIKQRLFIKEGDTPAAFFSYCKVLNRTEEGSQRFDFTGQELNRFFVDKALADFKIEELDGYEDIRYSVTNVRELSEIESLTEWVSEILGYDVYLYLQSQGCENERELYEAAKACLTENGVNDENCIVIALQRYNWKLSDNTCVAVYTKGENCKTIVNDRSAVLEDLKCFETTSSEWGSEVFLDASDAYWWLLCNLLWNVVLV